MANLTDEVYERLLAYIAPRKPETEEQQTAFDNAVAAQAEYETEHPSEVVPEGVTSVSNDGVSISYAEGRNALYTQGSISPTAYAYLFNARLIPGAIPRARRL